MKIWELEFEPKMTIDEFIEANIGYYWEKYIESNPTEAYKINDWDLDCVYESIDKKEVAHLMSECYLEFLSANYLV